MSVREPNKKIKLRLNHEIKIYDRLIIINISHQNQLFVTMVLAIFFFFYEGEKEMKDTLYYL